MINSLGYQIPEKNSVYNVHPNLNFSRMIPVVTARNGIVMGKTLNALLRYKRDRIIGIISLGKIEQNTFGLPVFSSFEEALRLDPDCIITGCSYLDPQSLPEALKQVVISALMNQVHVLNVLHMPFRSNPLFQEYTHNIQDIRVSENFSIFSKKMACQTKAYRVMTMGVDCSVGKMLTAIELRNAAVRHNMNAMLVPTGQTGILIDEWGMALDRTIVDFTSGAMEFLVQQTSDADITFIEGQGSVLHPLWMGLTMSMLCGACPQAAVMVYRHNRKHHNEKSSLPIADLKQQIEATEYIMKTIHPVKVVAISLNGAGLDSSEVDRIKDIVETTTKLPCYDPVQHGADGILLAIRSYAQI